MRAVLSGLLILSISASNVLAYGTIAAGEKAHTLNFTSAHDEDTYDTANALSLKRCRDQGLANCAVRWNFQNLCISIGLAASGAAQEGDAPTAFDARERMLANCTKAGAGACTEAVLACDQTATTAPNKSDPTASIPEVTTPPTLVDQLFDYFRLTGTLSAVAGLITFSLLAWIFVSIVSATPVPVLKQRALIAAWIGAPAALQFALGATGRSFGPSVDLAIISLSLWTDTFAALILGCELQRWISPRWKPPSPLSLPLATLAFTVIAAIALWLFNWYFLLPEVLGCMFGKEPCPYIARHEVYGATTALGVLVLCGISLPADSNLVVANNRLGAFIRQSLAKLRRKRQGPWNTAELETEISEEVKRSYPVPAIYSAPAVTDVLRLKLKRSQRSSMFGKAIFILDARMELTQEELDLVRKYRLGSDVIYESGSRKRRLEAKDAYLEMTKGGPGFRDSPGAQAWGTAKSFFWMGRAGLSAATAALSLRVTIDSLMSGVHVECKSLDELLAAERAIREAAENLRGYIVVARTFDGREEIIEF